MHHALRLALGFALSCSFAVLVRAAEPSVHDDASRPLALEGGRSTSRALVVVLHGGSYRARAPEDLAQRALQALDDEARRLGLRLLAPLAPDELLSSGEPGTDPATPWSTRRGEEQVLALVEQEVAARRADPARIMLAGHGAGATSAVRLAARHPQRFAAVALWSGTPEPLWDGVPGAPPSGSLIGGAGEPEHDAASRPAAAGPTVIGLVDDPVPALASVPVYLWSGHEDRSLDRQALALFVGQMREQQALGRGHELHWEHGPGEHDYGPGPRRGLQFLRDRGRARASGRQRQDADTATRPEAADDG